MKIDDTLLDVVGHINFGEIWIAGKKSTGAVDNPGENPYVVFATEGNRMVFIRLCENASGKAI